MNSKLPFLLALIISLPAAGAEPAAAKPAAVKPAEAIGSIERLDPRLDDIIPAAAAIYRLADGFGWAEGPAWIAAEDALLFTDIPSNTVFRWHDKDGLSVFLHPSGATGLPGTSKPDGSNGLTLDRDGRLLLCQHGDRRLVRLTRDKQFEVLADRFQGKRFNSPNDVVVKSDGSIYFTDPPFGLKGLDASPLKELPVNGVYRLDRDGELTLLTGELSLPNGLAFSPDESRLYVAVSDWMHTPARVVVYDVRPDGTLANGRTFFDAKKGLEDGTLKGSGLPDGIRVDVHGNVFATGPGGVLVLSPEGTLLGVIRPGATVANCGFGGPDRSVLYLTATHWLCRVQTKTRGL